MKYEFSKSLEIARADFDSSSSLRCQVWSFAWLKSKLIAIGKNDWKTHPLNRFNGNYGNKFTETKGSCAELRLALRIKNKTSIPYNKLTIVNVRLDKQIRPRNSCPCSFCKSLLLYLRPRAIFHTNDLGEFEEYHV